MTRAENLGMAITALLIAATIATAFGAVFVRAIRADAQREKQRQAEDEREGQQS